MAKVAKVLAAPGSLPSDSLDFCGGAMKARAVVKRKTPSELRVRSFTPLIIRSYILISFCSGS